MTWGVFELEDEVHVAPCDGAGEIVNGHVLTGTCPCQPRITERDVASKRVTLSHRDPGTPGAEDRPS